jgi:hypothetical protein
METPFNATITDINATEDFLKTQITQKDARITQLEEQIQRVTQRDYNTASILNRMRDAMQEWTLEAMDDESITQGQGEEVAEICGFDLTKEVEVEITVTYNLTVNVPYGEDVESIVNDIDFDTVSYNDEHVSYLSSSVDRVDF